MLAGEDSMQAIFAAYQAVDETSLSTTVKYETTTRHGNVIIDYTNLSVDLDGEEQQSDEQFRYV